MKEYDLKILFLGNSHTFYNDLPLLVRKKAEADGLRADVAMIAHGGWYLFQHMREPETVFNLVYGRYDYVVLQEHSHPFDRTGDYRIAAAALCGLIRKGGAVPVIYATWAEKAKPENQEVMNRVNREIAEENGALLAVVGESWQKARESRPDADFYASDGAHASPAGSGYAAEVIWKTIREHRNGG